jgi:hypothetical protein
VINRVIDSNRKQSILGLAREHSATMIAYLKTLEAAVELIAHTAKGWFCQVLAALFAALRHIEHSKVQERKRLSRAVLYPFGHCCHVMDCQ